MHAPASGIQVISDFNPSKVSRVCTWYGSKTIAVKAIPRITAANAIAPFWAKVIKPYNEDSVHMPDFHSPYSIVSGSKDQNKIPVAPLPIPIKPRIISNSFRLLIG